MTRTNKKNRNKPSKPIKENSNNVSITDLINKRVGGSINIQGINFQLLYATYIALSRLVNSKNITIHLEGIEDIDIIEQNSKEYIQTKTSINQIDAGKLWELKVLQNFMDVYEKHPESLFKLVHNSVFKKGNLDIFSSAFISDEVMEFWKDKFHQSGYLLNKEALLFFFKQISVEKITENDLYKQITTLLYERFDINIETEEVFLKSLFYNIFQWSKKRELISYNELNILIQSVRDSFSRFPINPALQHKWVTEISYIIQDSYFVNDYFEGKAARPIHIAFGLPVRRPIWESAILETLKVTNITIIKSSSGQGKSTLAWLTGQSLVLDGYKIYQLNSCAHFEQANAIGDFIETRLRIGETPLLIIDGLNQSVAAWMELAKLFLDKPVKILITTREEDWFRYGGDISKISMKIVNIKLEIKEAENIFYELKKNEKIHSEISTWQPIWEKIKDKGLLIEYVYLLTNGEMLSERLTYQVRKLQNETSASAKTEILRLVSLADVLNIKIQTKKITDFINNTVRFDSDRNEVYVQLEKEYYLKFDSDYMEGLHPVRSKHLVDLLHSQILVIDSLISLLHLLDEESIYDYFISAPFLFQLENKNRFYYEAATILAKKNFPEMVYAIDGLMHYEPTKYWMENKQVYDEVFTTGGILLFVLDSVPFNNLNTLENLSNSMGNATGSNMPFLITKLKQLSSYSINKSDVQIFVQHLYSKLKERKNVENVEGIVFLSKWLKKFGLGFPDIVELSEQKLLNVLAYAEIGQSADLFHFFSITHPIAYKQFSIAERETIIGWIKKKTNTLTITINGNDIHIKYLLDEKADKANEYSVYRINIVHAFFPYYSRYCTEVNILPFPNKNIYEVVIQNARKAIPAENLFDDFDIHINQIWSKILMRNYAAPSSYEWQHQYFEFRIKSLEVSKLCVRVFECHLMKDFSRLKSVVKEFLSLANELLATQQVLKKYPSQNAKYFEKEKFIEEEKSIDSFFSSFRNFLNQMSGIISPEKKQDRHLPVVNLKTAVYNLCKMQDAFKNVTNNSYCYFPFESLIEQECQWYVRLLRTIKFYIYYNTSLSTERIVAPLRSVEQWYEKDQSNSIEHLHSIIKSAEEALLFRFFLPTKIIEKEILKTVAIGVQNCDLTNDENLFNLSVELRDLSATGIHFFHIVFVNDKKEATGALRFSESYFEKFRLLYEGEIDDIKEDFSAPLPLLHNEYLLETLEGGIVFKEVANSDANEPYFKMMMDIWKLIQYRNELGNSKIEKIWLYELEKEYSELIRLYVSQIYGNGKQVLNPSLDIIEKIVRDEIRISDEEIVNYMLERLLIINDNL